VINAGIWDRDLGSNMNQWLVADGAVPGERRANGIAHVLPINSTAGRVDAAYISKNDGTSSTILLSENVNAISWPLLEEGTTAIVWTAQDAWLPPTQGLTQGRQYGINKAHDRYLDDQLLQQSISKPDELVSIARPSSNHSKGVNVAYCDGHVDFLADDVHPWIYARRMSISKANARVPSGGFSQPVPAQVLPQDANGIAVPTDY
jgi:prepilin-type processing-associated H-X9-DG protein